MSYVRNVPAQGVIYEGDSAYHYIKVVDDKQRNTRFLQFNNYIEGAIDLNPPYDTRVSYTNAFHLARIFKPALKNILIIGGGGGIGARKFVNDDPNVVVDLVEIDQRVVDLSLKYFHLEPSDRLRIHVEDGRNFIRHSKTKYDLVILDAFTIGGQIPFHLTTREFFNEIEQTLSPDGSCWRISMGRCVAGGVASCALNTKRWAQSSTTFMFSHIFRKRSAGKAVYWTRTGRVASS